MHALITVIRDKGSQLTHKRYDAGRQTEKVASRPAAGGRPGCGAHLESDTVEPANFEVKIDQGTKNLLRRS